MTLVKSFSVGNGDMFYIRHGSDNFSVIDCSLPDDRKDEILDEITNQSAGKEICRFISTHPDQDHISGLLSYDDRFGIVELLRRQEQRDEERRDRGFQALPEPPRRHQEGVLPGARM